ncbi:hypothetical protein CSB93_1503 [Pseudomonas paraeruginosa]|uniref:Uncharacterized protein n=1 Tax=Pseudomonas paraeruginosa TaxID=2994495 RepID=A0A2R3IS07_9PSED|nr:hypothetical protein CSB93_1503 [Pseudomonas paraeruginosa]
MNALLIFHHEQSRSGKWGFGQFRSSESEPLEGQQLRLKGNDQNPVAAFFKGI